MTASISSVPFSISIPPSPSSKAIAFRPLPTRSASSSLSTSSALSTTLSTRSLGSGSSSIGVLSQTGLQEATADSVGDALEHLTTDVTVVRGRINNLISASYGTRLNAAKCANLTQLAQLLLQQAERLNSLAGPITPYGIMSTESPHLKEETSKEGVSKSLESSASPATSSASAGKPPTTRTKRKASASGSPPPDTSSDTPSVTVVKKRKTSASGSPPPDTSSGTPSVTVVKRRRTITQKPKPTISRTYYLGLPSLDDTAAVVDYIVNEVFERYRRKISESDPKLNEELTVNGALPKSTKVTSWVRAAVEQIGAAQLLAGLDQAPWRLAGSKVSSSLLFTKVELYTLRKAWECHQLDLSNSDSGAKQYTYASDISEKMTALGVDIFGIFTIKQNIYGQAIDKKIFNKPEKLAQIFGVESDAKQMQNKMGELAGQLATAIATKHQLTEEGEEFSKAYAVFTASNNQKSVGFYAKWRNPPCVLDVRFASQHAPTASSSAASASTASTSTSSTRAAFSIQSGPTSHIGVSKAPATDTDPTHDELAAILLTLGASSSSASASSARASSTDVSATSSGPLQLPESVWPPSSVKP